MTILSQASSVDDDFPSLLNESFSKLTATQTRTRDNDNDDPKIFASQRFALHLFLSAALSAQKHHDFWS